jgi:MoaA/NifB/PqqE/SkfB family radical SAM enzyme
MPVKVLKHAASILAGKIPAIHPQVVLTNRCNLKCTYCSCENKDVSQEMTWEQADDLIYDMNCCGTQGITITGGGEPLLSPIFSRFVTECVKTGIKVGMATNGELLPNVPLDVLSSMSWIRISMDSARDPVRLASKIAGIVKDCPDVAWAFSFVITKDFSLDNIQQTIECANEMGFTHVRLVSDLLDLGSIPEMEYFRIRMRLRGVDDSCVVYQGRKSFEKGQKRCLISLLKPVVAADGYIYPCCGVQYALENPSKDFEPEMRMGTSLFSNFAGQLHYDGSNCVRCYYGEYNRTLAAIIDPVDHVEFV